jgi:glutaredoxin-related protein
MTTATMDDKALLGVPQRPPSPPASMMVEVARKHGVSPLRQMRESFRLALGKSKLYLHEYYSSGLFDPALSWQQKQEYIGLKSNSVLNNWLSPPKLQLLRSFANDKVLFTSTIRQLGFLSTETQAVVSASTRYGNIEAITSAAELKDFLMHRARYPLFGKPQDFSGSYGSALIRALEDGQVVLGNGKRVALDAFCAELIGDYGSGYLLQSALQQHPDMKAVTGDAVGSLRIVTVREEAMPHVLYSSWKIPAPNAMSDNFWQDGSMIAPIDIATGRVGQAWVGTGLNARTIDTHPVSGRAITGTQLPFWQEACRAAREVHAMLPEAGVIGWDVAISPDGPLIIECNTNPFHTLYQMAHRRGVRNPDFMPVFERVAARSNTMLETLKAEAKERARELRGQKKKR